MICINNGNSAAIQASTGTTELRRFKTRTAARLDAVAMIGPHARDEFEFQTRKLDGSWVWKPTDPQNIKAETPAQLKANGGKKSILAMAMAIDGKVAPVKPPMTDPASSALTSSGNVVGFQADDGIPEFLRRPRQSEEQKEAIRKKMAKTVGPERVIKNPPDATAAQKRAEKRRAAEAKFEGTPAHAKAKKAEAKEKAAKEAAEMKKTRDKKAANGKPAPKAAKPAMAGKVNKTAMVGDMLLRKTGCTTAEVLAATGWPAVSMPAQAKACGLKLRKEKKPGENTRYWGTAQ